MVNNLLFLVITTLVIIWEQLDILVLLNFILETIITIFLNPLICILLFVKMKTDMSISSSKPNLLKVL
ncbi:hypothetical protein EBX31_06875 [bacterium]|nr:hypothetical protein [bacterium]